MWWEIQYRFYYNFSKKLSKSAQDRQNYCKNKKGAVFFETQCSYLTVYRHTQNTVVCGLFLYNYVHVQLDNIEKEIEDAIENDEIYAATVPLPQSTATWLELREYEVFVAHFAQARMLTE